MKLLACHIENFGKLSDFSLNFEEKENGICQENGWGKSTLAAFLKAMFYGFDTRKDKNALDKERKLFEPWQGGVYGGQLDFETENKSYRILRIFGKTEKSDKFALYQLDSGMESKDFSQNIGEELFGLDATSFRRSIFIGQKEVLVESTDQIHAKLGNLAEHSNDMANFERAISRLKEEMNHLTPDRATGSIKRRKSEITQMREDLKRYDAAEEGYARTREILSQKEEEKRKLEDKKTQLTKTLRKLSADGKNQAIRETYQAYEEDYKTKMEKVALLKEGLGGSIPSTELLQKYSNKVFHLPNMKELEHEIEEIRKSHGKWNENLYIFFSIIFVILVEILGVFLHTIISQVPIWIFHILAVLVLLWGIGQKWKANKLECERRELFTQKKEAVKEAAQEKNEVVAFLKKYGLQASPEDSNEALFGMLNLLQNQKNELEAELSLATEAQKRMEAYAKQNAEYLKSDRR